MRILLINPPYTRFKGLIQRYFPIGLGYIAATLERAGHEAIIYNAENPPLDEGVEDWGAEARVQAHARCLGRIRDPDDPIWQEVRAVIQGFHAEVVGITCMTVTFDIAKRIMRIARDCDPTVPLVWGGPHPTEVPEQVIRDDVADFLIVGEGELTAVELLERLREGSSDFGGIDGLMFKREGQVVRNPPRAFVATLDKLPFPDPNALLNIHGFGKTLMADFLGDIVSSRGCPHQCTFCSVMNVWGRTTRWRSPQNVVDEIESLRRRLGAVEFHFWDDTFTINRRRTVALLRHMIERRVDVTWTCLTRADRLDEELVELMMEAGCYNVFLGLESGSDRQLAKTKKGITTDDGRRAARMLNDAGLFWTALMMVGLPEETEEEMMQTLAYLQEIRPKEVALSVFTPFPGTALWEQARSLGLIDETVDWSTIETKSSRNAFVTTMSPERFRQLYVEMTRWIDAWNTRNRPFWKGISMRSRFYKKHPALFLRRAYHHLYRQMKNPTARRRRRAHPTGRLTGALRNATALHRLLFPSPSLLASLPVSVEEEARKDGGMAQAAREVQGPPRPLDEIH
jgi:anaerobic magnesium-protoporphyrin IX monomethyl ester cyclase